LTLLQAQESEPKQGNELSHLSLPIPTLIGQLLLEKEEENALRISYIQ